MNKPAPKQEVAILHTINTMKQVVFYATHDAVTEFADFGRIDTYEGSKNKYALTVDARYDFEEVVAYIKGYGNQ